MGRHDIHAFLEVLRHRLPDSLDHMLAFTYIAYSRMAILHETVPTIEATWIECLDDLGSYRMAIEEDGPRDREVWSDVARTWYTKAAGKSLSVGRLYHHLAILARPCYLEQLWLYTKLLTCVAPFESARGSLTTLGPLLSGRLTTGTRPFTLALVFIRVPANLFNAIPLITRWANHFEGYSLEKTSEFGEKGSYTATLAIAAISKHGSFRDDIPCRTFQRVNEDIPNRSLDESEPMIATGTRIESSTVHQLINRYPNVLRSVLDQIFNWKRWSTSCRKASGFLWWSPVSAACKTGSSLAVTFTTWANFVVPATARTIPRNTSNEESTGSFTAAVIPLAHWPYLAFVIIMLLVAQYLAHIKDPIFIWGCMMTIWAFGWWTIRADSSTSLQISAV